MLNPLFAAIAMSSSSLLVIWNSSRRFVNVDAVRDAPLDQQTNQMAAS